MIYFKQFMLVLFAVFLAAGAAGAEAPVETVYVTGPRSTSLPFEISRHGQLFVPIQISGRTLKMLVDTGGANTSIDLTLAKELGIKPEGEAREIAVGGAVTTDSAAHVDIKIAEFLVRHSPVRLLDLADTRKAIKAAGFDDFDGVLGVDMMLFLRAKMDFGKKTLHLYRP